ncbi:MAG: hypothetical protein E7623_04315 [Ruminococcaceae bacterium]|nr:hypothetical protein [Oscillospiraceae bacterium]
MVSCTEFIPAYSELFKYIESKGGHEAVVKYWEFLSANGIKNLEKYVLECGIRGCFKYWSGTLNEEAADFKLTLDEENGYFRLDMFYCPSKGRLLEFKHLEPYHDYCGHCDLLYRQVLEPLGYSYDYDMSNVDKAACSLTIKKIK